MADIIAVLGRVVREMRAKMSNAVVRTRQWKRATRDESSDRSVSIGGGASDSVIISGDKNVVVHGNALVLVVVLVGLLFLVSIVIIPRVLAPTALNGKPVTVETGLCHGQPSKTTTPGGPEAFDYRFGYTFYNTNNSPGLALNGIRSLFMDGSGLWVGYGDHSATGQSGVSHVGFDQGGYRWWEYCVGPEGKSIGHRTNAIAAAKDSSLWVATDGAGAWRLQKGVWEQFLYDPHANNDAPEAPTYALAPLDDNMLVGAQSGVHRWKGAGWERMLYNKKVHAIAVDSKGNAWIGYISEGVSRNPWARDHQDFKVANGSLTSDEVRDIVIDRQDRVWVATDGGGLNVYENGKWRAIRAGDNGFPGDSVNVLRLDKYGRLWAGTGRGTVYLDGPTWRLYSDLSTRAIAFGLLPNRACRPEETAWDVWLGTDDRGLVNSRLPANSAGVTGFRVTNVPASVSPGQVFSPTVTINLERGFDLTQADFLQSLGDEGYTPNPHVGIPPGIKVPGGSDYSFDFASDPMKAPGAAGHYRTTWRLWQCGRFIGPSIPIEFDVTSP